MILALRHSGAKVESSFLQAKSTSRTSFAAAGDRYGPSMDRATPPACICNYFLQTIEASITELPPTNTQSTCHGLTNSAMAVEKAHPQVWNFNQIAPNY